MNRRRGPITLLSEFARENSLPVVALMVFWLMTIWGGLTYKLWGRLLVPDCTRGPSDEYYMDAAVNPPAETPDDTPDSDQ